MLPGFLVPETEVRESGVGPAFDLGSSHAIRPSSILITMGVTHVMEQESIEMAIEGSADGVDWSPKPLLAFPQKFYCGNYQLLLKLDGQSSIRYLRPKWTLNRWGRGELEPLFGLFVFAQEQKVTVLARGAA